MAFRKMITTTLYARQKKRQNGLWTMWEKARVDSMRE